MPPIFRGNIVKKKLIVLAIAGALASIAVTGCDTNDEFERDRALMEDLGKEATKDASNQLNAEKKELEAFTRELQSKDPSVSHAYYSDENGERQLNIVREDDNGNMVTNMLMGAVAGYALSSAMNSSGHNSYYRSQPTYRQPVTMSKEDEKKRRGGAYAGYVSSTRSAAMSRIKSNPSRMSTIKQGAFSRVASARSAGYSAGG